MSEIAAGQEDFFSFLRAVFSHLFLRQIVIQSNEHS
jgi:hypothetical protein